MVSGNLSKRVVLMAKDLKCGASRSREGQGVAVPPCMLGFLALCEMDGGMHGDGQRGVTEADMMNSTQWKFDKWHHEK